MPRADDDSDRIVREKWRRHLWTLACAGVDTTTRVRKLRSWSKLFALLNFDEDDSGGWGGDHCISDGYNGMKGLVDSSSEDEGMPDVQMAVVRRKALRKRRMRHSSLDESVAGSPPVGTSPAIPAFSDSFLRPLGCSIGEVRWELAVGTGVFGGAQYRVPYPSRWLRRHTHSSPLAIGLGLRLL